MVRLVALFLLIVPISAFAALIPIRGEFIQIKISPEYPLPGQSVTVTAHTSLESLSKTLSWTVNDEPIAEGAGLSSIQVTAGALGTETAVEVAILDETGIRGTARYIIRPAEVDLIWEGKTYVPPLYVGRRLANANASVVVLAEPRIMQSGRIVPKGELSYKWSLNGSLDGARSGIGRSTYTFTPRSYTDPSRVSVVVETKDGKVRGQGSATISSIEPIAVVYEDRPLSGLMFDRSVARGTNLTEDEITFRVMPYFAARPDDLSYEWKFEGTTIDPGSDDPRIATFRRVGDGTGTFTVEVAFSNASLLFERAASAFGLTL